MNEALLFTVKTVLRRLIDLIPKNLVPDINPNHREGILFNNIMLEIIHNAELNHPDPENFLIFAEALRKTMLFLMEGGYYRRYVTMFFDKVKREWQIEQ